MRSALPAFLALTLSLTSVPARAADGRAPARKQDSALSRLMSRISAYLNAEPVKHARVSAAVAAVRGGIPTDQGEDLDQRLLDRALLLRQRLLASSSPDDRKSLRAVYEALGVSQWVQAVELAPAGPSHAEARQALKAWAKAERTPAPAEGLRAWLADPGEGVSGKNLAEHGWGKYCRDLTPSASGRPAGDSPNSIFDRDTAGLDEMLDSLKRSWLEKKLPPAEEGQAHFLAGQVYLQLASAPLKAVAAPAADSSARAPSSGAAPRAARPAPRQVASAAPDAPAVEFVPRRIYAKASKAVVLILCSSPEGAGELGSGSVIDETGRVLTNAHVVIRDSTRQPWPEIRVYFKPEKMTGDPKTDLANPVRAKVLSWEPGLDLAVIALDSPPQPLATLSLANPDDVVVGDRVAAIGHPEQGGLWTLTTGVVSTLAADLGGVKGKNAFQTDASINRGNSGGPLLNASGDIIGVNTLMSRKAADGLAITAVNFAVRSDVAKNWLARAGTAVAYADPGAAPAAETAAAPASVPAAVPVPAAAAKRSAPGPKREMVTESKPYDKEKLIEEEIKEMEDLGDEMHEEIMKRESNR